MKFGFDWPSVSEDKMFEECGRRTDGRRTTEPVYTISSPKSLKAQEGSGELNKANSLK